MANTYVALAQTVLTGTQATVTFSSIASTYTDLVVVGSTRSDSAVTRVAIVIFPNSETISSTNGSYTALYGLNSATASGRGSNTYPWRNIFDDNGTNATASSFASWECYIPNYAGSTNKVLSNFGASESNSATTPLIGVVANLYSNTSAITQLVITSNSNFVSGSSFYLYGIKNS